MRKAVSTLWLVTLVIIMMSTTRSIAQDRHSNNEHAVFVMTNAVNQNEVISF
jgi:hypothetical protein